MIGVIKVCTGKTDTINTDNYKDNMREKGSLSWKDEGVIWM